MRKTLTDNADSREVQALLDQPIWNYIKEAKYLRGGGASLGNILSQLSRERAVFRFVKEYLSKTGHYPVGRHEAKYKFVELVRFHCDQNQTVTVIVDFPETEPKEFIN